MSENPLLPNAKLRELKQLLVRATDPSSAVEASTKPVAHRPAARQKGGRETTPALLAGTVVQLRPGDLVVPRPGDQGPQQLLPMVGSFSRQVGSAPCQTFAENQPGLLMACGLASALKRADGDPLVLAFAGSGSASQKWADALSWAQQETLPLIVVCSETNGPDALRATPSPSPEDLCWTNLQRLANRLKLPVLTVDGEDAVAVYRVMQESVLRARARGGPAVLWAVLPREAELRKKRSAENTPLGRLEKYLRTRNIPSR